MIELISYQVIKTLSVLNRWEVRGLIKFMQSTYLVSETKRKLFDTIIQYSPSYNSPEMTLFNLYSDAFPDEPYNHHKIINALSDINILIDYFLITELFRKQPFYQKKMEAVAFYNRANFEYFERKASMALDRLETPDMFTAFEKQSLHNLLHYYPYEDKKNITAVHLQNANDSLDEIYVINKLRYQCEFINRQQTYENRKGFTFKEETHEIAKALRNENILIDLYLRIIALYSDRDEQSFLTLKALFRDSLKQLPYYEAATIIILLTSFTNQEYNKRYAQYFYYQQELYQLGLEYNLFTTKGFMSHGDFMNIAVTSIGLEKFDFVDELLNDSKKLLKKEYQASCTDLVDAFLLFKKGKYGKVLELIRGMTEGVNKQIFFSLRIRFLEVRCLFELISRYNGYRQPFLSKYRSFYTFLQRKILSTPRVGAYINHLEILRDMAKIISSKKSNDVNEIEKIRKRINETSPLIGWEYLLKKVEKLEKNREKTT